VQRHEDHPREGLSEIKNLNYTIQEEENMVNVHDFKTPYDYDKTKDKVIDLRKGGIPFPTKSKMSLQFN
jgi:hypothetical protein